MRCKSVTGSYQMTVFLAPPVRFTNKSDHPEVVTCSAQASAQLTAEVSDYDVQVSYGSIWYLHLLLFACTHSVNIYLTVMSVVIHL